MALHDRLVSTGRPCGISNAIAGRLASRRVESSAHQVALQIADVLAAGIVAPGLAGEDGGIDAEVATKAIIGAVGVFAERRDSGPRTHFGSSPNQMA